MPSRLLWRRSAAALGIYASALLGFLGTIVAARVLGVREFGLFAIVMAATGFFQALLDLTVEEAVTKYGFRYSTQEEWGRLRRLFSRALAVKGVGAVLAGVALAALAPLADVVFDADGLTTALLVAALLPLAQAPEGLAATALVLHGRYDVRAVFLTVSMGLRLAAIAIGASYGLTETMVAIVLVSLRTALTPLLLGIVASPVQVAYFRAALSPQQGLVILSAPARLVLLTEQTRDWERGEREVVFRGVRSYSLRAAAVMAVALVPLLVWMPDLIELVFSSAFVGAADAARIVVIAAVLQFVFGWTKSFPVSVGRPNLRVATHGLETLVLVPLVIVLGAEWGATGAAAALLVSTAVFAVHWTVLFLRLRRETWPVGAPREAIAP